MRRRGAIAAIVTAATAFAAVQPAAARAPLAQLRGLHAGTAIVQFDRAKTSSASLAKFARTAGATKTVRYQRLPFVTVRGGVSALRAVANKRGVKAIHMNRRLTYHLHESVPIAYGGTDPHPTWSQGFDGRGINVAVVDTGIDALHPDLANQVAANFKVLADNVVACPSACNSDTTGGHGTHVAGIIAGDGTASGGYYTGMAPGAKLVGFSAGEVIAITDAIASFDYILAHNSDLKISVVNNSWGPDAGTRFDATDPVNVGTKALHDAGVTVVFSAGNSGSGDRTAQGYEGGSTCDRAGTGTCQINAESVAPWVISVGNTRKDFGSKPGDQPLNFGSSRGDPFPEQSADGSMTISYKPTLSAPGTNIVSARDHTGIGGAISCGSADSPGCAIPQSDHPEWTASYVALSGTSMASPHVAGAVAVIQSYAKAKLARLLTPDEVKQVLVTSAAPMTKADLVWDWPACGVLFLPACGESKVDGMTGLPYQDWQVGAGALDVTAALTKADGLATTTGKTKKPRKPH